MAVARAEDMSSVYGYWLQFRSALLFATILLLVIGSMLLEFLITNCVVLISQALNEVIGHIL